MQPPRLTLKSLWRLYHTARSLLQRGHTEEAAVHFHRIIRARVRRVRGEPCHSPVPENPLVNRARLGLCYCYVEQGMLEPAEAELERVLAEEPTHPEALCELAYIFTLRGRREEAREVLERAVRHNPDSARAHREFACFLLQENELERAIEESREAIRCDPGYETAYLELAAALTRAGRLEEAIAAMSRALQLAPDNPDYYFSLASLLRDCRRLEEAERTLSVALQLEPFHPELLGAMAELQLELQKPDRAIEYGQRWLRECQKSLAARDLLGTAYLQEGRVHEALRMVDQMVVLSPLDPLPRLKKAILFERQGMVREALSEYLKVATLAPESDYAEEALQAVEFLDNQQIRQVLLLAAEDPVFRSKLRRDTESTLRERGFIISEAGLAALRSLDYDGLASFQPGSRPVVYH